MRTKLGLLALLSAVSFPLFAQLYNDPNFAKPATGYGSDGPHTATSLAYDHPFFSGEKIEIFYPEDYTAPVPTIFFSHGYGGTNSLYIRGMLKFIAQKGMAAVYVPYPTTGVSIQDRYDMLVDGFRHAARQHPDIIDTTRVGFAGHSFGGGAMFGVSNRIFTENNWGSQGRCLFSMAPWYSYQLTQAQLESFPGDTKLIMHVYDEDVLNDHRMAIDVFENINIPDSEKDYILVRPDTVNGHVYSAGHDLPGTYQVLDAYDYYAFYRLLDALCDYTFNGSLAGKNVALGNGSADQVTMPGSLKPLVQTDQPTPLYPESKYEFNCSALLNPRSDYCGVNVTATYELNTGLRQLLISPNPASDVVTISWPEPAAAMRLELFDLKGMVVYQIMTGENTNEIALPLEALPKGMYVIRVGAYAGRLVVE